MTTRRPEPLLNEDNSRFSQLPYKYPEIQKAYEDHESAFWTAKEIDYAADVKDWNSLNDDERYFIEHILAFFAGADGIVLENLGITVFAIFSTRGFGKANFQQGNLFCSGALKKGPRL